MPGKIAYIHGRPAAHPMHAKFASSVGAEFHYVDFKMRWQDRDTSILYRGLSWFVCAFSFPKKNYDLFLVDNLHFMPVIMKMFCLRKKQKIVVHMGSHTLFFMYAGRFSRFNTWLHRQALKRYDAVICEGQMAEALVHKLLERSSPPTYVVINGIPEQHIPLSEKKIRLEDKKILFMGHGPGADRLWYKGLDLMIDAFTLAYKQDTQLSFTIVGNWQPEIQQQLLQRCPPDVRKAIDFAGQQSDLSQFITASSLYLHCARGEAYGLTVLIAMAHGLPSLVSEWTGTKEVVGRVTKEFISVLDKEQIAQKIIWYFNLPHVEKERLSAASSNIAREYTERRAIDFHKETFLRIIHDLQP